MNVLLAFTIAATAMVPGTIPLEHGTYVLTGVACKDAPFAAVKTFDAGGFSGPHDAQCHTQVLKQKGDFYKSATTCRANGDGSPAAATTDVVSLRVHSRTNFTQQSGSFSNRQLTYRLCAAA